MYKLLLIPMSIVIFYSNIDVINFMKNLILVLVTNFVCITAFNYNDIARVFRSDTNSFHHEETLFLDNDPENWKTPIGIKLPIGSFLLSVLYDNISCVYICSIIDVTDKNENKTKKVSYVNVTNTTNLFSFTYENDTLFIVNKEHDGVPSIVTVKITLI